MRTQRVQIRKDTLNLKGPDIQTLITHELVSSFDGFTTAHHMEESSETWQRGGAGAWHRVASSPLRRLPRALYEVQSGVTPDLPTDAPEDFGEQVGVDGTVVLGTEVTAPEDQPGFVPEGDGDEVPAPESLIEQPPPPPPTDHPDPEGLRPDPS